MVQLTFIFSVMLLLFSAFSVVYVFKYRGQLRYKSFTEYVRKGWPIFTPLNCFLYLMTERRAQKPIMDIADFEELRPILDNWEIIRDEANKLRHSKLLEQTKDPKNKSYYDIGFRTFYKYGWVKFYLDWYGYTHQSALNTCPKTVEIIKQVKCINGAMFSALPPGSKLTRHLDPLACSLRLHLALDTPQADECFINVDGTSYSWRNGELFLFDETYLHHANNNTEDYRLILMCDVERPMNFFGRIVNKFLKLLMRMTVVPNTDEDKSGIANKIFSAVSPFLKFTKELKKTHPNRYKIGKWILNTTLIVLFLYLLSGLFFLAMWIFEFISDVVRN